MLELSCSIGCLQVERRRVVLLKDTDTEDNDFLTRSRPANERGNPRQDTQKARALLLPTPPSLWYLLIGLASSWCKQQASQPCHQFIRSTESDSSHFASCKLIRRSGNCAALPQKASAGGGSGVGLGGDFALKLTDSSSTSAVLPF